MISDQYLAGIIDGEGYITIKTRSPKQKYRELVIGVSNTYLPLLEQLKEQFGGYISKSKMYKTNKKQGYHWIIKSVDRADMILRRVRPFLIIKAERADLALKFLDQKKANRHLIGLKLPDSFYEMERSIRDQMVRLNARNNHILPLMDQPQ